MGGEWLAEAFGSLSQVPQQFYGERMVNGGGMVAEWWGNQEGVQLQMTGLHGGLPQQPMLWQVPLTYQLLLTHGVSRGTEKPSPQSPQKLIETYNRAYSSETFNIL